MLNTRYTVELCRGVTVFPLCSGRTFGPLTSFHRILSPLHVLAHGKRLRMATKSIRVPALIQRALDSHPDVVQGLMVFNAREAALLWQLLGARCGDFLLAYPTLEAADVECAFNLALEGAVMTLMVDSTEQVDIIAKLWRDQAKVTIDTAVESSGCYLPHTARLLCSWPIDS